jgi:hypothetical protein
MHKRYAALGLTLAVFSIGASARQPLPALDRGLAGDHTQILVLGSVHLSGMPKSFKRESIEPVLDKLAAFKPQIVTIESLPGEQCDHVARHPVIYLPEDLEPYCRSTAEAKAATGLDVPAATAKAYTTLKTWPADPTPAQRRELAAVFLAGGEAASALVQWLRLPPAERKAGDGLDATLVAQLEKFAASNNESFAIGAVLAARLGLERVYAVDDHTGDAAQFADAKAYGDAVMKAWEAGAGPAKAMRERDEALRNGSDMLALYRYINQPENQRIAIEADFGAAQRDPSPQRYGRQYVGGWEARNLRMVASIRVAFRDKPGARVLAIVGSSHKPWFDGLLGQMQGVDIVDVQKILK